MKTTTNTLDSLILGLDKAVEGGSVESVVTLVKHRLQKTVSEGEDFLPDCFKIPAPGKYARRLVHADPQGRYWLMAMVWDKGQGTPIHDHNGLWVVECVYRGACKVTNYSHREEAGGLHHFEAQSVRTCNQGEADDRIPPFEHHVVENMLDTPTVSLHVFGGPMEFCHTYEKVENGYREVSKTLCLTQ